MAVFVVWLLLVALAGGVTIWLLHRIWKRRQTTTVATKVVAAVVSVAAISGALGTLLGIVKAFGAVGGESVDPSQKARILAEGIAEAMNCTAFGLAAWIPSVIVAFIMTRPSKDRLT